MGEVNARMGGGPVHEHNLRVWGVDLVEEAIFIAMGIPARPLASEVPIEAVANYFVPAARSGVDAWRRVGEVAVQERRQGHWPRRWHADVDNGLDDYGVGRPRGAGFDLPLGEAVPGGDGVSIARLQARDQAGRDWGCVVSPQISQWWWEVCASASVAQTWILRLFLDQRL